MGIACACLYATTEQPYSVQKQIFGEIASGLVRIIFTTAEKFAYNTGFRTMLKHFSQHKQLRFVIDEVHCVLEYQYFR
jgi:superfamily II DNA helicase RecQ